MSGRRGRAPRCPGCRSHSGCWHWASPHPSTPSTEETVMDTVTRRRFLTAGGIVAGGALAAGATAYGLRDILSNTPDEPAGGKTLVLVTLYGGCDGLNTVIPYADAAYAAARPGLAYQGDQVLPLDDALGLNPALKGLHELYGRKRLAIVRGVGYPKP